MTTTRGYWRRAISGHAGAEPNRALGDRPGTRASEARPDAGGHGAGDDHGGADPAVRRLPAVGYRPADRAAQNQLENEFERQLEANQAEAGEEAGTGDAAAAQPEPPTPAPR